MFERVQRASGLRISRQAAGRVEGGPGYAKIAGILLYWAAQASCSHRSGGTRRATTRRLQYLKFLGTYDKIVEVRGL